MKKKYLFIGGEFDGCWEAVETAVYGIPREVWPLAVCLTPSAAVSYTKMPGPSLAKYKQVNYRREQLLCESKDWYFYVLMNMTIEESIDRLIRGYVGGKEKKK
jgi:hypothetical protein